MWTAGGNILLRIFFVKQDKNDISVVWTAGLADLPLYFKDIYHRSSKLCGPYWLPSSTLLNFWCLARITFPNRMSTFENRDHFTIPHGVHQISQPIVQLGLVVGEILLRTLHFAEWVFVIQGLKLTAYQQRVFDWPAFAVSWIGSTWLQCLARHTLEWRILTNMKQVISREPHQLFYGKNINNINMLENISLLFVLSLINWACVVILPLHFQLSLSHLSLLI